jgi:DNA recombination protein RmuC
MDVTIAAVAAGVVAAVAAVACVVVVALLLRATQLELRTVAERVRSVEQGQLSAGQGIAGLSAGVVQTGTVAQSLSEATAALRNELSRAKADLAELHAFARARQQLEQRTADSVRRLEAVIAGTHSKGLAGENVLEAALARLPAEWLARDFRVANRTVEFGLRLPNGLVLPIDSKWPATALLEAFAAAEEPAEQLRLKAQIEAAVLGKAREVRKYVDPALTVPFGIAAVPDAVYELCWAAQAEAMQQNVVLLGYSMVVPYLLLVFQTVLKSSHDVDLDKLQAHLDRALECADLAQAELEGRFARGVTMLANSRDELSRLLSRVNSSLLAVQGRVGEPAAVGDRPLEPLEMVGRN